MTKLYGTLSSEREAQDKQRCYDIVKEIMDFGVNQTQVLFIIYLLSLELEDHNAMLELSGLAKKLAPGLETDESANVHSRMIV